MAVPAFWATPFSYTELLAVTDVATAIAGIHTALIALGWTDDSGVGTGPWKTPARSDGAFFKIAMTRTSATRLSFMMYDQAGINVSAGTAYCMDVEVAGNPFQIYAGTMHLALNSARPAQHESAWFSMMDQTPEPLTFPQAYYRMYSGPRVGSSFYNYGWNFTYCLYPGGTAYQQKQVAPLRMPGTTSTWQRRTVALTSLFSPAEFADSGNTPPMFLGRIPQAIVVDDTTGIVAGSEVVVPIDAGVNATFKVLGLASWYQQRLAFRKS